MASPDKHPFRQEQQLQQKLTPKGEVAQFINDLWYQRVPDDLARKMAEDEFGADRMREYDEWQAEIKRAEEEEEAQKKNQ